ncbi:unnamed protein product, partial [Fusarium fujikuroi]
PEIFHVRLCELWGIVVTTGVAHGVTDLHFSSSTWRSINKFSCAYLTLLRNFFLARHFSPYPIPAVQYGIVTACYCTVPAVELTFLKPSPCQDTLSSELHHGFSHIDREISEEQGRQRVQSQNLNLRAGAGLNNSYRAQRRRLKAAKSDEVSTDGTIIRGQTVAEPHSCLISRRVEGVVAEVVKAQALFGENQSLGKDLGGHVKTSPVPDRQLDHRSKDSNRQQDRYRHRHRGCILHDEECLFGHPYPAVVSISSHLTGDSIDCCTTHHAAVHTSFAKKPRNCLLCFRRKNNELMGPLSRASPVVLPAETWVCLTMQRDGALRHGGRYARCG